MNKRSSSVKLGRTSSHRKAMMRNMAESLFVHERIVTTRAKGKALRPYAEKIITRARKNLSDPENTSKALHHKRIVMSLLRNRNTVRKLFEDIAPRFEKRNGGYLRLIPLPMRRSDATPMSIIELVERKEKIKQIIDPSSPKKKAITEDSSSKTQGDKKPTKPSSQKDPKDQKDHKATHSSGEGDKTGRWYDRWKRKKKEWDS